MLGSRYVSNDFCASPTVRARVFLLFSFSFENCAVRVNNCFDCFFRIKARKKSTRLDAANPATNSLIRKTTIVPDLAGFFGLLKMITK